jgi:hypothetical protein
MNGFMLIPHLKKSNPGETKKKDIININVLWLSYKRKMLIIEIFAGVLGYESLISVLNIVSA